MRECVRVRGSGLTARGEATCGHIRGSLESKGELIANSLSMDAPLVITATRSLDPLANSRTNSRPGIGFTGCEFESA